MAYSNVLVGASAAPERITIRRIGVADLKDAPRLGLDDFLAMPTHAIFLCLVYPIVGIVLARLAFGYSVLPLIYPLASGFALVGPFAALGLYEMSRRREAGLDVSATHAFDIVQSSSIGAISGCGSSRNGEGCARSSSHVPSNSLTGVLAALSIHSKTRP